MTLRARGTRIRLKLSELLLFCCLKVLSLRGQNKLKLLSQSSPLGVKFKISEEHPRLFYMGVPSLPRGNRKSWAVVFHKYQAITGFRVMYSFFVCLFACLLFSKQKKIQSLFSF